MDTIVGKTIHFTNTSDMRGKPAEWFEWDFGDGNIDNTNWDTTHIYNVVGTYIAGLSVHTECGTCTQYTREINVHDDGYLTCDTGGCELLLATDVDNDGTILQSEYDTAMADALLTQEQKDFIQVGTINDVCPGCYGDGRIAGVDPAMIVAAAIIVGAFIFTQE